MLDSGRCDPPEPQHQPPELEALELEKVGDVNLEADTYGAALEYYERAVARLPSATAGLMAARLSRKISDCYRNKGELEAAMIHVEQATQLLRGRETEIEFGVLLGRRADILYTQGQAQAALDTADAAIDVLCDTAAHREYAFVQTIAAACHARLGEPDKFEQLCLDALATYRRVNDRAGVAEVYNALGVAYKNDCRWDAAVRALTNAKEICEELGLTRRLARTLGNLGIVHTKRREFDQAISNLVQARRLAQGLGDAPTLVSVLNSLGHALLLAGRYTKAEKYLLQAKVLAERHSFARSIALADEFLGDLMAARGRYEEARQNYAAGLRCARVLAPKGDVVGEILRRMADLELQSGLRSAAIATGHRALKICVGCGETHEIGFIYRTLGVAYAGLAKAHEAEGALLDSLRAFEAQRNSYELARSQLALARFYGERGSREDLLRALRQAQAACDAFSRLEEDRDYCDAGLLLAKIHQAMGEHDEGLLVLYDIERVCDECSDAERRSSVQALRLQFEAALVTSVCGETSQLSLFGELHALANHGGEFVERLQAILRSLCDKTACSRAFVSVAASRQGPPAVRALHGLPVSEARELNRSLIDLGLRHCVWSHVGDHVATQIPSIVKRTGAALCQPLRFEDHTLGVLYLERAAGANPNPFNRDEIDFVATYASLASVVLHDLFRDEFQAPGEVEDEPSELHPALRPVITRDATMHRAMVLAEKVAGSDCTVMLCGETGTGKGLLAHCIHRMSGRHQGRFVALNCAALPEQLLESELFGHVRGAFSGAEVNKVGLLEAAHGGTVFLDEVSKTTLFMQGKLLQFLDSSEVRPVGANELRHVDVRVISASKVDLKHLVHEGRFLEDLYYRLNDFPIVIPPLRERPNDIELLVDYYLKKFARNPERLPRLSRQAMDLMRSHVWPGNVRELEKVIKRALILAEEGQPITVCHLADDLQSPENVARAADTATLDPDCGLTLREQVARLEAQVIRRSMHKTAGNKSEAARMLGISYPSLLQKIKLYSADLQ